MKVIFTILIIFILGLTLCQGLQKKQNAETKQASIAPEQAEQKPQAKEAEKQETEAPADKQAEVEAPKDKSQADPTADNGQGAVTTVAPATNAPPPSSAPTLSLTTPTSAPVTTSSDCRTNQFFDVTCKDCDVRCATCSAGTDLDCLTCAPQLSKSKGGCFGQYSIILNKLNAKRTTKDKFFRPQVTTELVSKFYSNKPRYYTSDRLEVKPSADSLAEANENFVYNWHVADTWDAGYSWKNAEAAVEQIKFWVFDYAPTTQADTLFGTVTIGTKGQSLFEALDIGDNVVAFDLKDSNGAKVGTGEANIKLYK